MEKHESKDFKLHNVGKRGTTSKEDSEKVANELLRFYLNISK